MAIILIFTSLVVYQCSYNMLWFKVGSLFDIVVITEGEKGSMIPRWDLDDNTFFYKFYSQYSVSSKGIKKTMRALFSVAMVTYTVTIEIILWQIKTADVSQTADFVTSRVWPFVSTLLSTILILLQPFIVVISLLNKFYREVFNIEKLVILTCVCIAILISALSLTNFGPFQYTKSMLTKISIVGVTVMAILSGIASVSTLYYTFLFIKRKLSSSSYNESVQNINTNTSRALLWTADEMIYDQIENYKENVEENIKILRKIEKEPGGKTSILRDQLIEKIGWYHLEIAKLEHRAQQSTQSLLLKKVLHFSFLLYCFNKVIFTFTRSMPHIISNLLAKKGSQDEGMLPSEWVADPLAITIAKILDVLLFRFNYQYELDSLTKQISLILSISLFVCSLSTVATTISYLVAVLPTRFRILAMHAMQSSEKMKGLPKYRKEDSGKTISIIKNLIVSELTGIYVVATVLSIRSNLPFEVSEKVNELLGERFTVPNIVIDSWFETMYAISCILTFSSIKLAERILSS